MGTTFEWPPMDEDRIRAAALAALDIPRERCRAFALSRSWEASARQFLDNVIAANALGDDAVPQRVAQVAAR